MTQYNKILRTKRLYKCENCASLYQNRARAERCDFGDVSIFEVTMKRLRDYHKNREKKK